MHRCRKEQQVSEVDKEMHDQAVLLLLGQLELAAHRARQIPPGQFDGNLAAMASNLARAVAGLSAESRQRDKHAQRAIENMSDTEKLSVIKHLLATSTEQDKEEYRVVLGFGSLRSVL